MCRAAPKVWRLRSRLRGLFFRAGFEYAFEYADVLTPVCCFAQFPYLNPCMVKPEVTSCGSLL
jgi:hypothetical protein